MADARWRASIDDAVKDVRNRLDEHFERLERGDERMHRIEGAIAENSAMTKRIEEGTSTLVSWAENVVGFRNTVDWLAGIIIKVGGVVIAVGVIWWAIATGQLPKRAEAPHVRDTAYALIDSKRRHDIEGRRRMRRGIAGATAAGYPRPAAPVSVFAEDFSLLIRSPRRYRAARTKVRVLS